LKRCQIYRNDVLPWYAEHQIDEGRWFTIPEVDRLIAEQPKEFAASFRYIWQRFKAL